ncbi:MAG TPA: pitrilysin family protein [Bacteroidales bacterium]|nr:pitrilysin family protein [Bacteroidales bacterium]
MKKFLQFLLILLVSVLFSCTTGMKEPSLSIPNEKYTLSNGLTVILNEDKSDPLVAQVILYHVGSNRETTGKTGFAHLFEHMMFQRSENVGEDQFFKIIERAGGSLNGGTGTDQTVYFEMVPNNSLETAMWLESDRMGYLANTVTATSFAQQQNVVQNEKRQGVDNRPYGFTRYVMLKNLYPQGHPYSWDVIGEMEDLKNATIDDVKAFHKRFYIPNNATLVISGDFNRDSVKAMIEKYYGEIPSGENIPDPSPMNITLSETKKFYHEDNFARTPQYTMVFPTCEQFTKDSYSLNVLGQLLGQGKKSPLYKVLVKEKNLTANISAYNSPMELTGRLQISVTANPMVRLDSVEKAIFKAFQKFETEKFTETDLERVKARIETSFYSTIASTLSKSIQLASYNEFAGSPDFITKDLEMRKAVTMEDVWDVYNRYIKDKNFIATSFVPKGQSSLVASGSVSAGIVEEDINKAISNEVIAAKEEEILKTPSKIDRTIAPVPGPDPSLKIPVIWTGEAPNGMKIYGIEHHEVPLVTYSIVIKGGHSLDDIAKPGVAKFTAQMLNEGTMNKTPEELEEAIQLLGASISVSGSDENITVYVTSLARNFEKTISLVEEMLLEPRWDEEMFKIDQTRTINNLKRSKADPNYLAGINLYKLILGSDNILSIDSNGTEESVAAITMDDLKTFFEKNISPSVSDFLVVGDVDQKRVESALVGLNSRWTAKQVQLPDLRFASSPEKSAIYFVDVPGAKQSVINIGCPALRRNSPDFNKANVANFMLGASPSARLFTVLREEKGYTYGAYSNFEGQRSFGTFSANAAVRSDATFESVRLFKEIMEQYRSDVSEETVSFTKSSMLKSNALRFETSYALLNMLNDISQYDLPFDYVKEEEEYIRQLTPEKMLEAAQEYIDPSRMYFVIAGDAKTQLKNLEKIGLGKPVLIEN